MIELGAIMSPFLQVKESKYYLDEVQAKLSQHTLFYLRYKGLQKKSSRLQLVKFATYWEKHSTARPGKGRKKNDCAEAVTG